MRFDAETEGSVMTQTSHSAVGLEDEEKGHVKELRNAIQEAEKVKERDFPPELSEGEWPWQNLDFRHLPSRI